MLANGLAEQSSYVHCSNFSAGCSEVTPELYAIFKILLFFQVENGVLFQRVEMSDEIVNEIMEHENEV